jgi:hypothetical protein
MWKPDDLASPQPRSEAPLRSRRYSHTPREQIRTLRGQDARMAWPTENTQEAPIVIYSKTTSTHEDSPRGVGFLYSLNRLNVATSRAKCLSILVCTPQLLEP